MGVVSLSKESKMAYGIFLWLRKQLPNADICTLRHISVYVAMTSENLDIYNDLKLILSTDRTMVNLLLSDGTEIRFKNNFDKLLSFVVEKRNLGVFMTMFVSADGLDNLYSTKIVGKVVSADWCYVISAADDEDKLYFIKTYYKNNLMKNGTSYFEASVNGDIHLDCIDGLGYLTDVMVKLDLLYNNVINAKKNNLVRKKMYLI